MLHRQTARVQRALTVAAAFASLTTLTHAEIYRWDNNQLIPGTVGIFPAPGINLGSRDLQFASLVSSNLGSANLSSSNLTSARFFRATLTSANFTNAVIAGGDFNEAVGFSAAQIITSASYLNHDLRGIRLPAYDLSGVDLSGQDLTSANLTAAKLLSANLTGASIQGAVLSSNHRAPYGQWGISDIQLYSTASYQARDLTGVDLSSNQMSSWNFLVPKPDVSKAVLLKPHLCRLQRRDHPGSFPWYRIRCCRTPLHRQLSTPRFTRRLPGCRHRSHWDRPLAAKPLFRRYWRYQSYFGEPWFFQPHVRRFLPGNPNRRRFLFLQHHLRQLLDRERDLGEFRFRRSHVCLSLGFHPHLCQLCRQCHSKR
jgi:uncharacterized protein YjbI with pentapeptide repeats